MKYRLDAYVTANHLAPTRSQAESMIRLGDVSVNGHIVTKAGHFVSDNDTVVVKDKTRYVSRAGLKLASVAQKLSLDFAGTTVLDVGSSTGGFTDYALQHGAKKVIAVDVGTDQLHPSLQGDKRIELHEKTDIRDFATEDIIGIVVIDVSFISLQDILPDVARIAPKAAIAAMVKPQFEAGRGQANKGVIKNDSIRRQILKDFEAWAKQRFVIVDKADSDVAGAKGNRERFYLLKKSA
jgi:23S rRNA (cytidine1920-2'-O)/16S rRNA (cytidine1409-2'-O)-methyltransferase